VKRVKRLRIRAEHVLSDRKFAYDRSINHQQIIAPRLREQHLTETAVEAASSSLHVRSIDRSRFSNFAARVSRARDHARAEAMGASGDQSERSVANQLAKWSSAQ